MREGLKKERGFTLVELAIVLVIIGILLAGILKGQEMIKQAKVKRIKADIDAIVAACYAYQDKYGYWPGDNPNGTGSGFYNCGNAGTGNCADGYINKGSEYEGAWKELYGSELLNGNPHLSGEYNLAKHHPWGGKYLFRFGNNNGKYGMYIRVEDVPYDVAKQLDEKYDDGVYNSGSIQTNHDYNTPGNRNMYWYAF
jgi:prepilin-type N-terminal cleavage/methylation domain-containing protein